MRKIACDITSGNKDIVVSAVKQLSETSQKTLHLDAVRRDLRKAGLKSTRKKKRPFFLETP